MYGNYDSKEFIPRFDVYIGVNFWLTVMLSSASDRFYSEIVHMATSGSVDVCLVDTGMGTPFISALELRKLGYSYPASVDFSLIAWIHNDVGNIANQGSAYEMVGDAYDRLWFRDSCKSPIVIRSTKTVGSSQPIPYNVPSRALSTACESNSSSITLTDVGPQNNDSDTQIYVYWHFAELEELGPNDTREFTIGVPGYATLGPITPKYLQVTTIASPRISLNQSKVIKSTLEKTEASNRPPILNAFELYAVLYHFASPTNQTDVDAVIAIRDKYVVERIWQGDPCLPRTYQWDGLNCTYDNNNPPAITSLSLSSSHLTGDLPPSIAKLASLKYLNLSNNGFTGQIPKFLAYLPMLNVIDLSENNFTGPVPQELIDKASNKSIVLRLEGNMEKLEVKKKKKRHHFIIPLIICVACVTLLLILGTILLPIFKPTKKQEGLVDRSITSRTKQFTFEEIRRITDNFKKVVGRGGFGTVYYGVLEDGTEVAVKVLNDVSSTIVIKQFCAEAELLTRIHHVNLVSLVGYCDEQANMALVYDYVSCGNLQMQLSESNEYPLCWETRLQISIDAAYGLEYLHSGCNPPIIHRDIKPANILIDEMGSAKIADFGLSRLFTTNTQGDPVCTEFAGTRGYLDPEYLQLMNALSEKSDVYAFGIVLLQLLTGQPALIKNTNSSNSINSANEIIQIGNWVSKMMERGDILAIIDKRLHEDLSIDSALKFLEIAKKCVKPTGDQRPRMSEVVADLNHCKASEEFNTIIVSIPSAR